MTEFDSRKHAIRLLAEGEKLSALRELSGDFYLPMSKRPKMEAAYELEMASRSIAAEMTTNNRESCNFVLLLLCLLTSLRSARLLDYAGSWSTEAWNGLMVVRLLLKHFVDHLPAQELHHLMEADRLATPSVTVDPKHVASTPQLPNIAIDPLVLADKRLRADQLLMELIHILIFVDPRDPRHAGFYEESLHLLVVLFSSQLPTCMLPATYDELDPYDSPGPVSPDPSVKHYFLDIFLTRFPHYGKGLFTALMGHFIAPPPPAPPPSLLSGALSYFFRPAQPGPAALAPSGISSRTADYGDKSLILLLLLLHQPRRDNVFWEFLLDFREAERSAPPTGGMVSVTATTSGSSNLISSIFPSRQAGSGSPAPTSSLPSPGPLLLDFKALHDGICRRLPGDEAVLLLLGCMLRNRPFRAYVLSRSNPDAYCLPVLRRLHDSLDSRFLLYPVYTCLSLLLALTEDGMFLEGAHKVRPGPTHDLSWYAEKALADKSLSDIILLVLIRCAHVNLAHLRDAYVHACGIAILLNVSHAITHISLFAAHKLVVLFELLCRRYAREWPLDEAKAPGSSAHILEDWICTVLEALSIILHAPGGALRNPHLIYSLLHKRAELFTPSHKLGAYLAGNARIAPLQASIADTLDYMQEQLDAQLDPALWTAEAVMAVITGTLRTLSPPPASSRPYSLRCTLHLERAEEGEQGLEGPGEQEPRDMGGASTSALGGSTADVRATPAGPFLRFALPHCWSMVTQSFPLYWEDERILTIFGGGGSATPHTPAL